MRLARLTVAALAATSAVLTFGIGSAAAAGTTETVRPSDVGHHWYPADTRPSGTFDFSDTYGGGAGTSSALVLSTPDIPAKVQMLNDTWAGTRIADITALSYDTYMAQPSGTGVALPALNLRIDTDGDGLPDRYLVFEPYQAYGNGAVEQGVWQSWDAIDGGQAKWWMSGAGSPCPQSSPCTWSSITTDIYPDAVIQEGLDFHGSLGFNQGSGNAGLIAAADTLHVATADRGVTYDFQTDVVLSGKDDCKKGGWATSTDPVFKNQGQCVSYFAGNGKARG